MIYSLLFPLGKKSVKQLPQVHKPIVYNTLQLQSFGVHSLTAVYSAYEYASCPTVKQLIYDYKYSKKRELAQELSTPLLSVLPSIPNIQLYTLVPVPLHWLRLCSRTFNQSALLAKALHIQSKLPYSTCLRRIKYTGSQAKRNRAERLQAMRNAFCTKGFVPKHILLIDDVWTTGSTLQHCAKALLKAGAQEVSAITIAYTKL